MRIKFLVVAVLVAALLAVLAIRTSNLSQPPVIAAAPRPVAAPAPPVEVAAPAPPSGMPVGAAPPPHLAAAPHTVMLQHAHLNPLPPPAPTPVGSEPPPPPVDLGKLVNGNAQWQGPNSMTVGDTSPVAISIGPNSVVAEALRASLANAMGAAGTPQPGTSAVQISPRMSASVSGVGFDITPAGPQEQEVSPTEPTTWTWQATATASGRRYLTVVLTAELGGGQRFTSLNEPISVSVKPPTFQQNLDSWIAMLTSIKAIVVLVIAILSAIFSKPVTDLLRRTLGRPADRPKNSPPPAE